MTVAQAAALMAVHPKTVRRMLERRRLTYAKVEGAIRIRRTDVDRYVDANTFLAVTGGETR